MALAAVLFIIIVGLFGYFYYKKMSPLDAIKSVPVGEISQPPEFKNYIFGASNNEFVMPLSVTVDSKEIFVSDSDRSLIQVFDYNGKFLRFIGNGENKQGKLNHPYGITFYKGELYVADGGLGKILIYDRQGNFLRNFEPKEITFSAPSQIVVKNDKVIVPDLAMNKVLVYDMDGNLLFTFGRRGEGEGQFLKPHGLAVDSKDNFYVADANNNRVQMFDENGKFLKVLSTSQEGSNEVLTPRGLYVDSEDRLYVVSGLGGEVYIFAPNGGKSLIGFGNDPEQGLSLTLPNGIWIDDNKIFVTETMSNRVAIFEF
jgi:DNA-binding beta-propeller fold protein YncE